MPFDRPTLSGLRDQARQAFDARLPGADSRLRHSNIRVIADVFAGLTHLEYGYLDWLARQVIPDTAETEYLERWAGLFGLIRTPAGRATGTIRLTGTDGVSVPTDARLQTADGQVEVRVTTGGTIAGGAVTVPVEALAAGAAGNLAAGSVVSLVSAIAGVDARGTVTASGLAGGADAETDDSLRARLLARIRRPPHGGAAHDYVAWARAVPGVTRVWVAPEEAGRGTVTVRVMMDAVRAEAQGIPTSGDLAAVAAAIAPVRPVTAEVHVVAPIAKPLDVTIAGLDPDTPEVRAAVAAEIADLLRREAAPGATIALSWIWEAVSVAAGERRHRIVAPVADVRHGSGEIAVMGAISHV